MAANSGSNTGSSSGRPASGEKICTPAGAKLIDGALGFLDRAHDVGEAERGDKTGEAVGMLCAKLRHRIVGDARQGKALARRGDILDRWIGQRDDLPVIAELDPSP